MIKRCYNDKGGSYDRYGGRGVCVCDEWRYNLVSFYKWAMANGWEEGKRLDKDIKGNGLIYSPATCCFVTVSENMRNTRKTKFLTYNNETRSMVEWSEITGLSYATIKIRINKLKWSVEKSLSTPSMSNRPCKNRKQ